MSGLLLLVLLEWCPEVEIVRQPSAYEVSVVVPAHGRPETLRLALTSLVAQNCPTHQWEVIVVDDGSPQPLKEIVTQFMGEINVGVVRQEQGGPAKARNRGIREANADIIAFIDDDCVASRNWIVNIIHAFSENAEIDAIGGQVLPLCTNTFVEQYMRDKQHLMEPARNCRGEIVSLATANAAIRRRVLLQLGGFDESFARPGCEDTELIYRLQKEGYRLLYSPDVLVRHAHPKRWRKLLSTMYNYGHGLAQHSHRHGLDMREFRFYDYEPCVAPRHVAGLAAEMARRIGWVRQRYCTYRQCGSTTGRAFAYAALDYLCFGSLSLGICRFLEKSDR